MENIKEKIEDLANYDQCAHVPPLLFAQILEAILVMADATELQNLNTSSSVLPKVAGAFTYQGYPCHMRCVEHSGSMYIIFCSYHNGTSGSTGCNYILYLKDANGNYKYYTKYSSSTVTDWVKRAFSEAVATASYPGIMSNTLFKRLDAVYNYCVSKGMTAVS